MKIKSINVRVITLTLFCITSLTLILIVSGCNKKLEEKSKGTNVRIGWQVAWATQGQLALVLQNTNVLELNGLKGDFKSFTYGAPLSEAALAGQLDVAFIGDQPAVNLLSRSSEWKLVARLMDFRVAIVIPNNSTIKSIKELKGKTLGIPFGASTHRVALQMLTEAGLDPNKDVKIVNIDIQEQNDVIKAGGGKSWPKIDAFASWDHHIALYESKGLAKILQSGTALGVIAMSKKFYDANPQAASAFLAAFKLGYYYYANNQDQVDKWFSNATQGKFDVKILHDVAMIEPNIKQKKLENVNIALSDVQNEILQFAANFAFSQGLIKTKLEIHNSVLGRFEKEASINLQNQKDISEKVRVVK